MIARFKDIIRAFWLHIRTFQCTFLDKIRSQLGDAHPRISGNAPQQPYTMISSIEDRNFSETNHKVETSD